jgi:hypothetical protein
LQQPAVPHDVQQAGQSLQLHAVPQVQLPVQHDDVQDVPATGFGVGVGVETAKNATNITVKR